MNYVVPAVLLVSFIVAIFKKIPLYDTFIDGAKEAARLMVTLLPYYVGIFLLLEVFEASGLNVYVSKYLGYFFSFFGIPKELSELMIVRPLSGSGSMGILEKILEENGADSYVGRCASVIAGASDTVFYIAAVYLSECKEKRAPLAVPVSLVSVFVGNVLACFFCRFM